MAAIAESAGGARLNALSPTGISATTSDDLSCVLLDAPSTAKRRRESSRSIKAIAGRGAKMSTAADWPAAARLSVSSSVSSWRSFALHDSHATALAGRVGCGAKGAARGGNGQCCGSIA
eukprot:scaffold191592_cov32-Tisochrysis_lutea.AAC.3